MVPHVRDDHRTVLSRALLSTLLAFGAGACTNDTEPTLDRETGTAVPVDVPPEGDLYSLASSIAPGDPGELIATQRVEVRGVDATVLRVLYHSRSVQGEDIAVSGLLVAPPGPPPAGGRDILSFAHGTTGIADRCAPSLDPTAAGLLLAGPLLERGLVVAATDYEGLGTPGRHPYLVGESEGRGVLDIARAARHLGEEIGASNRVVIWGHSQGGHAALFANQIAPEWAPELEIVGTVAGAPPSQLSELGVGVRDGPFQHYVALVVAGWAAAYPDADPAAVLTDTGVELLDAVDETCALDDVFGAIASEDLVERDPMSVEPWASLLDANEPGQVAGPSPVLIVHGEADELIPVNSSQRLLDRMCAVGQLVERRTYPDQGHGGVVVASLAEVLAWTDSRLAGEPAPTSCP